MSEKFFPPKPHIEDEERLVHSLDSVSASDLHSHAKKSAVGKYVARYHAHEKAARKAARKKWLSDNWIALLSLIFAFIAALPVIIPGIETILKWLTLLSSAIRQYLA